MSGKPTVVKKAKEPKKVQMVKAVKSAKKAVKSGEKLSKKQMKALELQAKANSADKFLAVAAVIFTVIICIVERVSKKVDAE